VSAIDAEYRDVRDGTSVGVIRHTAEGGGSIRGYGRVIAIDASTANSLAR
jgi:hypothetical protein